MTKIITSTKLKKFRCYKLKVSRVKYAEIFDVRLVKKFRTYTNLSLTKSHVHANY